MATLERLRWAYLGAFSCFRKKKWIFNNIIPCWLVIKKWKVWASDAPGHALDQPHSNFQSSTCANFRWSLPLDTQADGVKLSFLSMDYSLVYIMDFILEKYRSLMSGKYHKWMSSLNLNLWQSRKTAKLYCCFLYIFF